MKKFLTVLLTLVLACGLLASCGGSREKTDISGARTLADLKGATLAAQADTFHLTALDQVEGITVQNYPDFTDLLNALNSGAIDGYVAEEPTAYAVCLKDATLDYIHFVNNETGFTATDDQTGIAVAFATGSEMVAKANAVIATISGETRMTLMEQMVKISADAEAVFGESLALSSDATDTSGGVLKIAMECAYSPFNWTQTTDINGAVPISGKTGMYANGYDVQVAKYIAAELGMSLEVYAYEWDSLLSAVQSGAVDSIIAGMSPTEEREEEVDFTNCYYNSNLVVIYKK